jgi:hypothetical protein
MNISRAACAPGALCAISLFLAAEAPPVECGPLVSGGGGQRRAYDWPSNSPLAKLPTPAGFVEAAAATAGWFIGGYGTAADGTTRPVCWDWAFNATDMLPPGAASGVIVAADPDGDLEVTGLGGSVVDAGGNGLCRAAFWPNPPRNTIVDLHPASPDYLASSVYAVRAVGGEMRQAGMAVCGGAGVRRDRSCHAMTWRGTAASAFDLHDLLPDEYLQSTATFIDLAGNVAGAAQDVDGVWHAVFWART